MPCQKCHYYLFSDADPTSDIFIRPSNAEYLVCTKTTSSEKANPVIGFSVYHEPTSIITLLSDGSLVTLGILYASILPKTEDINVNDNKEINSPLKKVRWLCLIFGQSAKNGFNGLKHVSKLMDNGFVERSKAIFNFFNYCNFNNFYFLLDFSYHFF